MREAKGVNENGEVARVGHIPVLRGAAGVEPEAYLAASVFSPAPVQPEMPADMCFTFL